MPEAKHTNALIHETSPYLLQHAHNPVNWHPWSEEAFRKARHEDKPVLLSIGYSACHWCHVMEHESFENEEIAKLMNDHFVNIKVDREERPDLDAIYMHAVQMMTGQGGWPMTVFLTPDQVPFYGGTYFPPEDRYGMPGFPRLLLQLARAYKEKRTQIANDASIIIGELQKGSRLAIESQSLSTQLLDQATDTILSNYDGQHGGFGTAPKFPPSMSLLFVLRSHRRTGTQRSLEVVEHTLERMAHGGIYDQLGGGFHRYSVDARWLVPHFEKMLYDNALLARTYLEAFLATGNDLYRRITVETLDYVLREMTSPEGGFYSTQDADSEGHEGRFFVWTPKEVEAILGEADADLFCRYFDVSPEGNFEGRNILNVPRPARIVAKLCRTDESVFTETIERGRKLLFETREKRAKPGCDEKILTSWNGLMLRSFADAANALGEERYRGAAIRSAGFLLKHLRAEDRLLHTWKDGEAKIPGYLEDYANLIDGLISVYEATFNRCWLEEAEILAQVLVSHFWDGEEKGFYFTADDNERLITRPKDFYDNATPSGNSVAAAAFLRLSELTADARWKEYACGILERMAIPMARYSSAFGLLLCAADFAQGKPKEIAVIGDPKGEGSGELLKTIFRRFLPNKVVACGTGDYPALLRGRAEVGGKATAYVCENYTCRMPVNSASALVSMLES